MSAARKGVPKSEEHRAKIGAAHCARAQRLREERLNPREAFRDELASQGAKAGNIANAGVVKGGIDADELDFTAQEICP